MDIKLTSVSRERLRQHLRPHITLAQQSLDIVKDGGLDALDRSWKLCDRKFPYSCTDEEGMLIWLLISSNNLRHGFEVATAFGYSTIYAALAIKRNGGLIHTLDCYVEETSEDYQYSVIQAETALADVKRRVEAGDLPRGLDHAMAASRATDLQDAIRFHVGFSPADVPKVVGAQQLDYVMIDGGHFGEQPTLDFLAVRDRLASRCAVLFHDNNGNKSVEAAIQAAERALNAKSHRFNTRYGLTVVGRGISAPSIARCDRCCIRNAWHTRLSRLTHRMYSRVRNALR